MAEVRLGEQLGSSGWWRCECLKLCNCGAIEARKKIQPPQFEKCETCGTTKP